MSEPHRAPSNIEGPIPRWRLAPPGRPAAGAEAWIGRLPALALLAGAALVVGAAVWPLAEPPAVEPIAPPSVPTVASHRLTVADRERALGALEVRNLFSIDGRFWAAPVAEAPPPEQDPGAQAPNAATPGQPNEGAAAPIITSAAEMPADIKAAFENLELRGIRTDGHGELIAMISFIASANRLAAVDVRSGEEFSDEKHAQAKWRVVSIDTRRDRVVLERIGKRVSLAMYPAEPVPVDITPDAATPEGDPARPSVAVTTATPEQVVADLRAAGVDEQEIALLMRMVRENPDAVAAAAAARPAENPAQSAAPTGLEAVTELMRSVGKKKEEAPKPPPPDSRTH